MPDNAPKWTPGPWRVGIAWPTVFDVVADVPPGYGTSGSETVLSAHNDIEEGPETARANATLASAATDLYDALEQALADILRFEWYGKVASDPVPIRAALLKANPARENKTDAPKL